MRARASTAAPARRAPPRAVKSREVASAGASARSSSNRRATRSAAVNIHRALGADDESESESESDAESSDASSGFTSSSHPVRRTRPPRRKAGPAAKRRRLRADDDDDTGDADADDEELVQNDGAYLSPSSHVDVVRTASAAVAAKMRKRKISTRSARVRKAPSKSTPKKARRAEKPEPAFPVIENKVIPAWNGLPYLILVQIFTFASAPLSKTDNVRLLLDLSRACRAFAEPALTALYKSPPILTMPMAHGLAALLERNPAETMFNYRQKIESLCVEVGGIATLTYRGQHLDITAMIARCPRLVEIALSHRKDEAPFRSLDDNLKWTYPSALLKAWGPIESGNSNGTPSLRLKSWRWNWRMMPREMSVDDIRILHMSPCLSTLRSVTFVNYQRPSLRARDAEDPEVVAQDQAAAEALAGCIGALPNLTHLAIESSTAANELLLPLLPKQLQHLELVNCWDVTAEHFAEYLLTHGSQLRYLTLNHNQSLSLEFLPILGEACPNLRGLRMDLIYYNHHEFYNDSNPLYVQLLSSTQVPNWPRSIEIIELEQLRKWDAEAAEMFFQSLVDSAPNLPILRHLSIKAMLDIPWRQRSELRDKWVARLNAVFRRKSEPPLPIHSLRVDEVQEPQTPPKKRIHSSASHTPSRRSNRIATVTSRPSSRGSSTARGLRKLDGEVFSYREPDTDEDLGESGSEPEDALSSTTNDGTASPALAEGREKNEVFIHGMCEVVDIRFDNQKPREEQWGMDDFLDSENGNSDEDWTGDNNVDEDAEYAW